MAGLGYGTTPEHGHRIVGKAWGPEKGNEGKFKERHEERTEGQVRQDKREGNREGENVNFYENMIHHGEGGMIAPGECPLTVGPGPGSKYRGKIEKLKPAGVEVMNQGGTVPRRYAKGGDVHANRRHPIEVTAGDDNPEHEE